MVSFSDPNGAIIESFWKVLLNEVPYPNIIKIEESYPHTCIVANICFNGGGISTYAHVLIHRDVLDSVKTSYNSRIKTIGNSKFLSQLMSSKHNE